MASYFDDHNIKEELKKKASNPNVSSFMTPLSNTERRERTGRIEFLLGHLTSSHGIPASMTAEEYQQMVDNLISQLLADQQGVSGPPPASKRFIDNLETVEVDKSQNCTICMEDYSEDKIATKVPCGHVFHKTCLVPWLELHNTCPMCRKDFPTDVKVEKKVEPPQPDSDEDEDWMYG